MRYISNYLLMLLFLCGTAPAFAQAQSTSLDLKRQSYPREVELHNISNQAIWLNIIKNPESTGAQAGYASELDAHHMSIFRLTSGAGSLRFVCYQDAQYQVQVDCHQYISTIDSPAGDYWLRENQG